MLTPNSHGLSQLLVRFRQTVRELKSRWEPTALVLVENFAERIGPGPLICDLKVLDFLKPGNRIEILHLYTKMNSFTSLLEKLVRRRTVRSTPGS